MGIDQTKEEQIRRDILDMTGGLSRIREQSLDTSENITQVGEMLDSMRENFKDLDAATSDSMDFTHEISNKANAMREEALSNKKETLQMAADIEATMTQKIEESKAVQRIEELSEEILGISRQTNMLACAQCGHRGGPRRGAGAGICRGGGEDQRACRAHHEDGFGDPEYLQDGDRPCKRAGGSRR